ncbi:MAG: ribosome small subunit-dependent GTPase A [Bacteroidia bacterium]
MIGVITKSTGSWYEVRDESGNVLSCRLKGKIKLDDLKHTNPIAVGDMVHYEMEEGRDTGVIYRIEPRKNYIIRKASNLSKQTHIIAANLDQAILLVTLSQPETSMGFIDRFLLTSEAYHIPAILIFNKSDLLDEVLKNKFENLNSIYSNAGYPCILCSALKKENLEEIKNMLKDKTSLIIGHSGAGKSTLLNALEPGLSLRISGISDYSGKGKHTTTFAEMFPLSFGGFIIDTPGIREFGVVDFKPEEISHYFSEMRPLINGCKFNNCKHIHEPGCAVIKAVEAGRISKERYNSYLSIFNNEDFFN